MTRKPDETAAGEHAGEEREPFLSRWSRKKEEARQAPPQPAAEKAAEPREPAPELPPVDKLTIDSDYRAFFHPKVDEDARRAALKKLFSDPRFNVMDGLDVYIDDYSKTEPIPPAMLAGLRQAQNILRWAKEDKEKIEEQEARQGPPKQALEPPAGPPAGGEPQASIPRAAPDGRSTDS